jgi:hypothetical protein
MEPVEAPIVLGDVTGENNPRLKRVFKNSL